MKQTRLLSVFILLCLVSVGYRAEAARIFAPNTQRDMSATRTYCQGATPGNVRFRYYTCNSGTGTNTGVSMTVSWYQNAVDATTGGTLVSSSTVVCARNTSGALTYAPSTATPGTSYYYCVVTWSGAGTCNTSGTITSTTTRINVSETPGPISGADVVCIGTPQTYTNSASGGTWSRSNSRLTIGASTGVATGVSAGAVRITYRVGCGTRVTKMVTVAAVPTVNAITGTMRVCAGGTRTLNCTPAGGTWQSSNTSIATIGPSSRVMTGVAVGSAVITYTRTNACGTASATRVASVTTTPAAITGNSTTCTGQTLTYTNSVPYGVWTSTNTTRATVVSTTGEISALTAGNVTIRYNTGCTPLASKVLSISASPATITGTKLICDAGTTTLSCTTAGGTWSSGNTSVATVNSAGVVTAVSLGTAAISYTLASSCDAVAIVTVGTNPAAIGGASSLCSDDEITMTNTVANGVWSSSNTSVATIDEAGTVTPVAQGATTITYSTGCGADVTKALDVYTQPAAVTGTLSVCRGATTTLANSVSGGVWSTEDASFATVNSSGVVTGVAEGTVNISYMNGTCYATEEVTVSPLTNAGTITGDLAVCEGDISDLETDGDAGGAWTSSNTSVATVNSSGTVTGQSAGTANITYSVTGACGAASTSVVVTVNGDPVAGTMSGSSTVCESATTALSSSASGGVWASSNSGVASVDGSGVVSGIAGGNANITYTVSNACGAAYVTQAMTVNPLPSAGTITGTATVCASLTTALSNAISGGAWTSSNTSVATINSSGVVSGLTSGTTTISYGITNSCGTSYATQEVTVNAAPSVAGITGTGSVCEAATTSLTNATGGGAWSSSDNTVATVGTDGVVSGVASGNATISYTVTNSCGTNSATLACSVNGAPSVAAITGTLALCGASTSDLDNATAGGAWSSSNTAVATVGTDGVVAAVSNGTATITYAVTSACGTGNATAVVTVGSTPASITGSTTICMGGTSALSVTDGSGGTWSSSSPAVATVNSTSGVVSSVSVGTSVITYASASGCFSDTAVVTVSYTVPGITGANHVCEGFATTLSNSTTGGVWSSSNTSVATIDASTGVVNGLVPGTVTVSYTVAGGCFAPINFYVYTMPLPVTGTTSLCTEGYTVVYSTPGGGGFWSSSDASVATVNSISGWVDGITAGTATVTYRIPMSGCEVTQTVTVNQAPANISGVTPICATDVATFTSATSGGTWTSTNTTVATIDASTGSVAAITGGGTTISYTMPNGCYKTFATTVNALPAAITSSTSSVCLGVGMTMSSATSGGAWSSSNASVATIGTNGAITSQGYGTSTISYTANGCFTTTVVTITAGVAAISGPDIVCKNYNITLADETGGGMWLTSNSSVAAISWSSGVLTGMTRGTATISYRLVSNGCIARKTIEVADIAGNTRTCMGTSTTLTHAIPGGTWSCNNTARATIDETTGEVTPVTVGTAIVTYRVSPTIYNTAMIFVNALPAAITGANNICLATTSVYTGLAGSSATWSSSDPTIATIHYASGAATAVAEGTVTLTYKTPTTGCFTTKNVTIIPAPAPITGASTVCTGETTTLESSPMGGVWTASNTVATVNSTSGAVTGNMGGGVTITYTAPNGCRRTKAMTVNAVPANITGPTTITAGGITTLSCGTTGGTWSSSNTTVAIPATTAGVTTGTTTSKIVNGLSGGTATISYTLANGCAKTAAVTVVAGRPGGNVTAYTDEVSGFRMYPNPTNGLLTIESASAGTLAFFTFDGKLVQEYKLEAAANSITLPSSLAAGMYMCQFRFDDGTSRTEKLMYQN